MNGPFASSRFVRVGLALVVVVVALLVVVVVQPGRGHGGAAPAPRRARAGSTIPGGAVKATPDPSALAPPPGFTSSERYFDDAFAGTSLNPAHWRTYISDDQSDGQPWNGNGNGGSGPEAPGGDHAEYYEPSGVSVEDGLTLSATRGSEEPGYSWTSGVVTTYGLVSFSGGYVQVSARMPDMSNGMWPAIWFLGAPGSPDTPEIDLYEGGFTQFRHDPNTTFAAAIRPSTDTEQVFSDVGEIPGTWHVYGMDYQPGKSITCYFDGRQVARFTTHVPTGSYFLILELQVAQGVSWHSTVDASTPNARMQIGDVQMYASPAS